MLRVTIKILSACLLITSCRQSSEGLFVEMSPSSTNIHFENKLEKKKHLNILYYLYYYNGGGVATGDINNDGLPDIYFTANSKGNNKLYLNKGNFEFEDITEKAGVAGTADWCTGVSMADVNSDGLLDIYVSAVSSKYELTGNNELYLNKGNNSFVPMAKEYGLNFTGFTTQSAFFDYDRDGDLDCYVLNQSQQPHANIVDTSKRRKYDPQSGDVLYRNDLSTTGSFTDVSKAAGISQSNLGYGLGIAIGDIDNDGWDDVYIGNDFHENDYYYHNNQDGTFTESGAKHFGHYSRFSMGNDVADYNNDGQLDIITVDMLPPDEKTLKTYGSDENPDIYKVKLEVRGYQNQYSRNCLQRNNGNGESFSETALMSGVSATDWSWAPLFADFDNDGNKDLVISSGIVKRPVDLDYIRFVSDLQTKKGLNQTDEYDDVAIDGMPDGGSHPFFFKGSGENSFQDVSNDWGTGKMKGYYNGTAYADFDNDGDLDLVMNCIDEKALMLKNNAPRKHFVSLQFKGDSVNTFGLGAKAYVFAGNKLQYQQLMLTRGFQSSCDARLHFGLDSVATIDSLLVVWPDQRFQLIRNPKSNQGLQVNKADASGQFDYQSFFPAPSSLVEEIVPKSDMGWTHKENDFLDFNIQYLIPHQLSTRGPKVAVGDVNNDGLDDFYVCGATGQAGSLMIRNKDGRFSSADTAIFNRNIVSEEVDAIFFDANNDGSKDLYIVSGGNEFPNGHANYADKLFLNDGKGHFRLADRPFPPQLTNKSSVAAADVDKDGDIDLFVGGLSDPRKYGYAQASYLLLNDGKGNFKEAATSLVKLDNLGMVTSAAFADVDNDADPDLLVTGEWMPLKIFMNNNGIFSPADVPQSTGLWQTICTTDVNGDGFVDILAGNWGHNSKLYAGKSGPLKLYSKDFDKNGTTEQVMAYTIDGNEYTFLCKDELERPLPVLKKAYLKYSDVAGKTVQYMFYDLFKDYQEMKAETLTSSCFINDGKGNFRREDLPEELQLAPVFSFVPWQHDGTTTYLAGGNFYGVIPYEGRYDALFPTFFSFDKGTGTFNLNGKLSIPRGEVRDLKVFSNGNGGKTLLIARNNNDLLFYQPKNAVINSSITKATYAK
ncbi:MAG: VCBS repeat-containing protein [Chitinophagaceae bacterium]|nr:VCBS repeat-containing protein [Chitinophagaceae bacterium]